MEKVFINKSRGDESPHTFISLYIDSGCFCEAANQGRKCEHTSVCVHFLTKSCSLAGVSWINIKRSLLALEVQHIYMLAYQDRKGKARISTCCYLYLYQASYQSL